MSLFAALTVLLFLVETRPVVTWFVASAALAVLSFGAAVIAAMVESRRER